MKKCVSIIFALILGGNSISSAQTHEAQQLLLDVEKLASLKNILTDLKTGYEIVSGGYNTIRNISEGNFNLHESYLNSLLEISPAVKKYERIAGIISAQAEIVSEYKTAFREFRESGQFTAGEMDYLGRVYRNLFSQSLRNLDALVTVVTAGQLRMSDDERISAIDDIWKEVRNELVFLRHFNDNTKILALQRIKEAGDVSVVSQIYNVNR